MGRSQAADHVVERGLITGNGVRLANLTAHHMEEISRHVGSCSPVGEVRMPIVAPLWPAFLIYHRFCGVRRSQRHNLTPIAPESSIREAVSAPTATLLSRPASCLDAGHAFLCAIAFSGENTTLRATSISFGELRDARFARHNPRRPLGAGTDQREPLRRGRLSAFRAPLQSLPRKQRWLNKQQ